MKCTSSRFKVQGSGLLVLALCASLAFASAAAPTDVSGEVYGGVAGRDAIVAAMDAAAGRMGSIAFVSNELTEPGIIAALKRARGRFENVQGVVGTTFAEAHPEIVADLRAARIEISTVNGDGSRLPSTFAVIDNITYQTPFRWTAAAFETETAPTIKVVCCDLAMIYLREFERAERAGAWDAGARNSVRNEVDNRHGPYALISFAGVTTPAEAQTRISAYFTTAEWDELIVPHRAAMAATAQ